MATPRATTAALPAPTSGKAAEPGRADATAEPTTEATEEAAAAADEPRAAAEDETRETDDWLADDMTDACETTELEAAAAALEATLEMTEAELIEKKAKWCECRCRKSGIVSKATDLTDAETLVADTTALETRPPVSEARMPEAL